MYQMMTPGPTMPAASVMEARSRAFANPDEILVALSPRLMYWAARGFLPWRLPVQP